MSEHVHLKVVPLVRRHGSGEESDWESSPHDPVVGKDILELLSTSMYVDPMSVYREYIQNAADSIDEARAEGLLSSSGGTISIHIDAQTRVIRIRDDGMSIAWPEFVERLSNLGSSRKRGTPARGFRGVGRLSGLGYCQELIFRGRTADDSLVSELKWDGRALKAILRNANHDKHLKALMTDVISLRRVQSKEHPKRFFEVEMRGVIRHRDDRLLSDKAVADYLSQVAPVPFSPDFNFGPEIVSTISQFVRLGNVSIYINGSAAPLYRPHENVIKVDGKVEVKFQDLELLEIPGVDGGVSALGWILHHEYGGALSNRTLIKGIRLRTGNVQVGDNDLLEHLFAEPRFNSWSVGEIHIVDPKILANGRRDHFEHSVHLDNVINQLGPAVREITRRCRQNSIARKWVRQFEAYRETAMDHAKMVARGGITKASRQVHTDAALKSLGSMRKVLEVRNLDEEIKASLTHKADGVETRIKAMLGDKASVSDPLCSFPSAQRNAYKKIISMIYECSANRVAAGLLVERLLGRLAAEAEAGLKAIHGSAGRPRRNSKSKTRRGRPPR